MVCLKTKARKSEELGYMTKVRSYRFLWVKEVGRARKLTIVAEHCLKG